ncbi:MAG: hypothetical protein SNI45_02110 [Rikenellaceae bacterium]
MTFDIRRQSVLTSLTTLFVMCVAGFIALYYGDHISSESIPNSSLLGGYVTSFQQMYPLWGAALTALIIFYSSYWLGRNLSTQNVYSSSVSLQLPLLGAMGWSVVLSGDALLSSLIFSTMTIAVGALQRTVRHGNTLPQLFNATLALSLLSLLYPPTIMVWLSMPILLLVIGEPFRSWIVAFVGLLFVPLFVFYIFWLFGDDFMEAPQQCWNYYITFSGLLDFRLVMPFRYAIMLLAVILALLSTLWLNGSVQRTRVRLQICFILLLASIVSFATPSATMLSFGLLAPVAAVLMTLSLTNVKPLVANITYLLVLALVALSLFTPLYLSL